MPFKLDCALAPDRTPVVLVSSVPEPMAALDLLRMLKAAFREQYRQVWYEIEAANGKRFNENLILPNGVGRGQSNIVESEHHTAEPAGDLPAGGSDGPGDVPGEVS